MTDHLIKTISRVEFLKLAGLTVGGISAGSLLFNELFAVPAPLLKRLQTGPGIESFVPTICGQCSSGCGLLVRRIDGVPVGVKGNPIFPVNRGGVCPEAHASIESLYHPDRIKEPQLRTATGWQSTDWDTAITTIADRLAHLRSSGQSNRLAIINGNPSPVLRSVCQSMLESVESNAYYDMAAPGDGAHAVQLSHSTDLTPVYDLGESDFILSFGNNMLEEGAAPVYFQRILAGSRKGNGNGRGELISIDSRLNLTASSADQWVPIRPGSYGALALGIAHVLIVEGLYDDAFVRRTCSGFDSYTDADGQTHTGFEALVRRDYYPDKVAEITGVPARTILELGEKFGTADAPLALSGSGVSRAGNGTLAEWAVYCLNALVGNFQQPGGVYFQALLPTLASTGSQMASPRNAEQFLEKLISGSGPAIDLLLIIDANPLFHSPQKDQLATALQQVGLTVSLGTMLDETAQHSDMALPIHHWLESTDLSGPVAGLSFSHIGYQQAAVEPLHDSRPAGDLIIEISERAFQERPLSGSSYGALINEHCKALYDAGRGAIISRQTDDRWLAQLRERGWQLQQYDNFAAFKKLLKENGGWWDPVIPRLSLEELFKTPSGKFEFVSSFLRSELGVDAAEADLQQLMPRHVEPSLAKSGSFPLVLTTSWLLTNRDGRGAALPLMLEMLGIQSEHGWESWLDINPLTAAEFHLKDRQTVWLESSHGRIRVQTHLFEGIRPGVVHMALGLGHTSLGRYGTGIGANATDIMGADVDPLSGFPALNGTPVILAPATRRA